MFYSEEILTKSSEGEKNYTQFKIHRKMYTLMHFLKYSAPYGAFITFILKRGTNQRKKM